MGKKNNMKNYVQIGSNVGNDYFQKLISNIKEKSNIFLFEPNNLLIEQLKENYLEISKNHNVIIVNKGVVVDKNINKLYVYKQSPIDTKIPNYGLTSIIHRKSFDNVLETIPMETITFDEFCKEYDLKEIELLMIDTEGYDYEILNSIKIEEIDIKEIACEHWGCEDDDLDKSRTIRTGNNFLYDVIKPKFEKYYSIDLVSFDEIPNDVFKKVL